MFYWYDQNRWRDLSARAAAIVDAINRLAANQDGVAAETKIFVWKGKGAAPAEGEPRAVVTADRGAANSLAIPVTKVECFQERLSFYRQPCWLFKLTCKYAPAVFVDHATMALAYQPPLAFLVLRATAEWAPGALAPTVLDETAFDDLLRISWNAVPIHAFNDRERGELDLRAAPSGDLDTHRCSDYLRFFTAFIRAVEGPFLLVERFAELDLPIDPEDRDDLMPLAQWLVEQRYRAGIDDFARAAAGADDSGSTASPPLRADFHDKPIELIESDDKPNEPGAVPADGDGEPAPARARFAARMLYGDTCFDTTLAVDAQGLVSMDEDKRVAKNPRWAIHETAVARNDASLLLRRKPRRSIAADTVKTQLQEASARGVAIRFVNQRVSGHLDLTGLEAKVAVDFHNVEFLDDVGFDAARLEHGLVFS